MNTNDETPGASAGELTEEVRGEVLNLSDPALIAFVDFIRINETKFTRDPAMIRRVFAAYASSDVRRGCGSCLTCDRPSDSFVTRMYVCAACGNKRCPAAVDCLKWECSGSNEPGQVAVPRVAEDAR